MPGAPILSGLPIAGWQKQGFDREQDRVDATRLQKRKQLQELADRAAEQGRELSVDEWFSMAQSEVGPGNLLSSSNPTGSILESVRLSANERAKQVAQEKQFRDMQNVHLLEDQVEKRVEQLSRSGKSEAEIQAELAALYPEKIASRFASRVGAIAQRADVADQDMGMRLGGVLNNTKEAEDYIAQRGAGLTEAAKRGIRQAAKAREDASNGQLAQLAQSIGGTGGFQDNSATRARIKGQLAATPWLNTPETVEKVMEMARASNEEFLRGNQYGMGQYSQKVWAGAAPSFPAVSAQLAGQEEQRAEARIKDAMSSVQRKLAGRVEAATGVFGDVSKIKDAGYRQRATMVSQFLGTHDVDDDVAQRLVNAAASGKGLDEAMAAATKMALPLAKINEATRQAEMMRAGQGFTGDAASDYQRVSSIGMDTGSMVMQERGRVIAKLLQRGRVDGGEDRQAEIQLNDAINKAVQAVTDTRHLLADSGRFGARAEDLRKMEVQALANYLRPLAAGSGIPLERLLQGAVQRLPAPADMSPRRSPYDLFQGQVERGFGQGGLRAPSGYPMGLNDRF